jgi:hypothetical protein
MPMFSAAMFIAGARAFPRSGSEDTCSLPASVIGKASNASGHELAGSIVEPGQ